MLKLVVVSGSDDIIDGRDRISQLAHDRVLSITQL